MPTRETAHSSPKMLFEFCYLEVLPYGCVAADDGARFLALDVVAVEAKGPHCMARHHTSGSLLGLVSWSAGLTPSTCEMVNQRPKPGRLAGLGLPPWLRS